jgi:hypothetical protein
LAGGPAFVAVACRIRRDVATERRQKHRKK